MKIYIVGSGKLANALLNAKLTFPSCEVEKWDTKNNKLKEKAIVIHAGSGRQLQECLDFCTKTKSVFVELSTGLQSEKTVHDFPFIICPNTSILVLKTMHILRIKGEHFKNYDISITESHQSTKTTEPGTAFTFAQALNFPTEKIVSVRNPEIQQNSLNIPQEYLDKHAFHRIVIKDGEDEITIETKVLGHKSYARGVSKIIEAILKNNLENKNYTVWDLIESNLI